MLTHDLLDVQDRKFQILVISEGPIPRVMEGVHATRERQPQAVSVEHGERERQRNQQAKALP